MINVTQTFLPPLDEYTEYLHRIWASKWLTNRGELLQELEVKLCAYLGVENLLAVSNGTIALQIAIKALGLKGEIITTPLSYVATVSSIVWENCEPVFVDIDKDYLTIDETKIEAAITDKTSGILATHVYGNPCNVEVIRAIAEKHNLKVIYDAAHCFGVTYNDQSIFNYGDVSTCSFHATKLFHTGEGGAIFCNDSDLFDKLFYSHNFGHKSESEFFGLGINAKISELQAAMGLAVFPYVNTIISSRKKIVDIYDAALLDEQVKTLKIRSNTGWNYSYYPIIFPTETDLTKTEKALNKQNIFPRRYFYPSLNKLPYVRYMEMPIAEEISKKILCLPLFTDLAPEDTNRILEIIKSGVV